MGPVSLEQLERPARVGERFLLYRDPERAVVATFGDDVRAGLSASRKHLSPKYLYDGLGSALFEAICFLPEYYLTRAESEILDRFAAQMVGSLDGKIEIVERPGLKPGE